MPTVSILRDPEALRLAATQCGSIREALESLGLRAGGGNYRAFRKACDRLGLAAPTVAKTSQVPPPGRRIIEAAVSLFDIGDHRVPVLRSPEPATGSKVLGVLPLVHQAPGPVKDCLARD